MFNALSLVYALLEDGDDEEVDPKAFSKGIRVRGPYRKPVDKFHNSDGSLSNYAFACGYVQEVEIAGVSLRLWKEGLWHVRAYDNRADRGLFWDSFESKGEAVRRYRQEVRRLEALQRTGHGE